MVFYRSFHEALRPAPRELQAEVCMAVFAYALDGLEPAWAHGDARREAFEAMRPRLDADARRAKKQNAATKNEKT